MKKTINVRPIIIKVTDSILYLYGGKLFNRRNSMFISNNKQIPVLLVLVSLENEPITPGDKYLVSGYIKTAVDRIKYNKDWYIKDELGGEDYERYCKKLIAIQSEIPDEYIEQFIVEYNNSEVKDLSLELEEFTTISGGLRSVGEIGSKGLVHHSNYHLKLTDGFINIVKTTPHKDGICGECYSLSKCLDKPLCIKERTYTDKEVETILIAYTLSEYVRRGEPIKFFNEYKNQTNETID